MSYTLFETNMWKAVDINNSKCRVPHDWHLQKVSDLAYHITTGKKDANAAIENGIYPFYTCGEKNLAINEYSFDTNALVLNGNGAVGDVKMAAGKFDAYQRNYVLTGGLPLKYSYYVFKKFFKHAVHLSGSVMPYITLKDLQKFEIRIPPLAEQTAIANILSDQEALIAKYDNLIALHKKRFAYLSDELLSGRVRLVQKDLGEIELVRNVLWQEKELNGEAVVIPRDWNHGNVGTLFKIVGGGTPSSTEPKFWDGTIPWLGPKDMGTDKLFIKEGTKFLSDAGAAKLGKTVKRNSVIVSTRAPVGYINIAENYLYTNQGCQSLYSDQFDAVYVAQWLRLNKWVLDKNSAGSTFKELSSSNLKKIHIWYPPLPEQTAIANVLSDQEALIAQYRKLREAEKKRFDWLSDALLSGTYRVKVEA